MPHCTLIGTAELESLLADPAWIVFDCRHDLARPEWGEREYREAHIPGARFLHLDRDLSGEKTGRNGRHPLPEPGAFATKLGEAGVDGAKQVVAYDSQGGMVAARLWWMLRWLGHEQVAVLDGGWTSWTAENRPCSIEVPARARARFTPSPKPAWVDAEHVLRHLAKPGMVLVDARSPERFRGEGETIDPVGGRIPGARNRFYRDNLDASGRFKLPDALRRDFLALIGTAAPREVVHQCGSGVSACHNALAMELAGLEGSRLYPGSWSEWCADPDRPAARG